MLSIDVGYGNTKYFDGEVVSMFPSVYYQVGDKESVRFEELSKAKNIVLPEGNFLVGSVALKKGAQPLFDKQDIFRHKIFILTAILSSCDNDYDDNIIIGLPINDINIMKAKLEKLAGTYEVTFNGVKRKVTIRKVIVYAQSESIYAVLRNDDKNIDEKTIGIIDIGQKTVDCAYFEQDTLVTDRTFSIDGAGCLSAYESIVSELNDMTGGSVQAVYARRYIDRPDLAKAKEQAFTELTEAIIKACATKLWNWKLIDTVYVVGGGATYTADIFRDKGIEVKEIPNSVYNNVFAFYQRGNA